MPLVLSNPAGAPPSLEETSVNPGNVYFVVPAVTASGGGRSFTSPFKTMAEALAVIVAGDTIYVYGVIAEAAQTLSVNNVQIIGLGRSPQTNSWTEAAKEQVALLTVTGHGCYIKNIWFRGCRSDSPSQAKGMGIIVDRADYLTIEGCDFQGRGGSSAAIDTPGTSSQVVIRNCRFYYWNTASYGCAIYGHTYTSTIDTGWLIEGNIFHSNLRHIYARQKQSVIRNNDFTSIGLKPDGTALTATTMIDISGGMFTIVTRNVLPGDYSNPGGYYAGTSDNWTGNFVTDVAETAETSTAGITILPPAA